MKKWGFATEESSITLETALVLPIFLMAVISLFDFFVIMNYQNVMQNSMNNTAQTIGRNAYAVEKIRDLEFIKSSVDLDSELITSGITLGYAWNKILSDEVKTYTESSNVLHGVHGISLLNSSISSDDKGINDLKADYIIRADILGRKVNLILENRCYFRSWIGESISHTGLEEQKLKTVYITRTGTVYHLTNTCSYINIVASKVRYQDLEKLRNANGSKYRPCSSCVKTVKRDEEIVYITSDGTRYHSNKNCSRIKREVTAIDLSKVGARTLCTKCKKR